MKKLALLNEVAIHTSRTDCAHIYIQGKEVANSGKATGLT